MKKYSLFFIILVALFGCNNRSKKNLISTFKKGDSLYIEDYRAGLIGNLTAQYLTDSVHFRVYLGTFDDENGYIYCKVNGDNIYVEQREHGKGSSPQWDTLKVISRKTLNIKDLKKQHKFE